MSARLHRNAILTVLQGIEHLTVFDGIVATQPTLDPDGKVHPYAVLWAAAAFEERTSLAVTGTLLDLSFQVTCAGGDVNRCLWAVDQVRAALVGVRLTVTGWNPALISQPPGVPTVLLDEQPHPPRHYTPLQFRVCSVPST